jgi:hypothetical protein
VRRGVRGIGEAPHSISLSLSLSKKWIFSSLSLEKMDFFVSISRRGKETLSFLSLYSLSLPHGGKKAADALIPHRPALGKKEKKETKTQTKKN